MPRISYFPVEQIDDPELRAIIDHAARHGTPRPESQAIRAHVPAILRDFWMQWEAAFRHGVCDHAIKELCRVYVSKTVECLYCGHQRSTRGREGGLVERDYDELLDFEGSDRYDERQKAALAYTRAIAWSPDDADDALWSRLHLHFSDEELVELGYFVAVTFGQQSWIRTLEIGHHEVRDETVEGLAPSEIRAAAAR
jgi:alkylhydroperoxidase family enzyme